MAPAVANCPPRWWGGSQRPRGPARRCRWCQRLERSQLACERISTNLEPVVEIVRRGTSRLLTALLEVAPSFVRCHNWLDTLIRRGSGLQHASEEQLVDPPPHCRPCRTRQHVTIFEPAGVLRLTLADPPPCPLLPPSRPSASRQASRHPTPRALHHVCCRPLFVAQPRRAPVHARATGGGAAPLPDGACCGCRMDDPRDRERRNARGPLSWRGVHRIPWGTAG